MPKGSEATTEDSGFTRPMKLSANLADIVGIVQVCEICDGYMLDLDHLRSHMELIHKVKITDLFCNL